MRLVAFFLLFLSTAAWAAPSASDPAWLALLHFKGSRSSIDPKVGDFFLDPNGYRDAAAELKKTQEYFAAAPEAPCRFPARAKYLHWQKPGTGELCARWQKWQSAISPKGLELVFASAFLNSPASMYGHTLLKFPRSGKTEGQELLDYTLNYGADTGGIGGVGYIWLGLFGGFNGLYSTEPFYLKVKEYNFVENRDFWLYPITLSSEDLQLLLAHAWELRGAALPYYFLRKNCSYYLLEFLEVARPTAKLTEAFPFWAVPLDTIRVLKEQGLLAEPRFRPSRAKKLEAEWTQLSGEERAIVEELARGTDAALPKGREVDVLDAAYDLWRYRNESKQETKVEIENKLLQKRAQFKEPVKVFIFSEATPESGHRSGRLGLLGGADKANAFGEIQYRGTFHDLLGAPEGYEKYSELSMGDLRARFEKQRFYLERADILRIRALSPRSQWFPRFAWSFRVAYDRAKEFKCQDWRCAKGIIAGGPGISVNLGAALAFVLAEADTEVGGIFDPNYRVAIGPSGGIFLPLWSGGRALVEGEYRWKLLGEKFQRRVGRVGLAQSISVNWEARAQAEVNRGYREASFGIFHYF